MDCGRPHVDSFPTTRWSLVAHAARVDGEAQRDALGRLLQQYLPAMRAHLLARGISRDRADDLLQGFVADKVLERDLLAAADAARGRFRSLLVTSLNNYAANCLRDELAAKRSPAGVKLLSLDQPGGVAEASASATPDAFDVAWARETLSEALRRMRAECLATGRPDLWEVLEVRAVRPALEGAAPMAYDEMVRRWGYTTPKQAANALITAKRRFEQVLRSVVAEYVTDEQELESELSNLGEALAAAAHLERDHGVGEARRAAWGKEAGNGG
jgi:RNA polymerase sigma-70 factor (ECF subfamily)